MVVSREIARFYIVKLKTKKHLNVIFVIRFFTKLHTMPNVNRHV